MFLEVLLFFWECIDLDIEGVTVAGGAGVHADAVSAMTTTIQSTSAARNTTTTAKCALIQLIKPETQH